MRIKDMCKISNTASIEYINVRMIAKTTNRIVLHVGITNLRYVGYFI